MIASFDLKKKMKYYNFNLSLVNYLLEPVIILDTTISTFCALLLKLEN